MSARIRLGAACATRDEDFGPQLVSWGIALAAAAAWLTLVQLTPAPVIQAIVSPPPTAIDFAPGNPRAPLASAATNTPAPDGIESHSVRRSIASEIAAAGLFTTAVADHAIDEVKRLMAAQSVRGNTGVKPIGGEKSTLVGGEGTTRPGMSSFASGQGTHVGDVQRGGQIDRATYRARELAVVTAPALENATADATELGAFVRARVSQLQSCYERTGGTDFAGVVALRLTLGAGGTVRSAEIVRRSWSGPGAVEAEACLLRVARGWRLPSGQEGASVTFPISFTRGT
jgi:hypothetical protein